MELGITHLLSPTNFLPHDKYKYPFRFYDEKIILSMKHYRYIILRYPQFRKQKTKQHTAASDPLLGSVRQNAANFSPVAS